MPLFKHDCMNPRCCRYIGSTKTSDVYTYGADKNWDNDRGVIIRKGDEGNDYLAYVHWKQVSGTNHPDEAKLIHDWMHSGT